jgi:hypothetical protein
MEAKDQALAIYQAIVKNDLVALKNILSKTTVNLNKIKINRESDQKMVFPSLVHVIAFHAIEDIQAAMETKTKEIQEEEERSGEKQKFDLTDTLLARQDMYDLYKAAKDYNETLNPDILNTFMQQSAIDMTLLCFQYGLKFDSLNIKNTNGQTPAELAQVAGNLMLAQVLNPANVKLLLAFNNLSMAFLDEALTEQVDLSFKFPSKQTVLEKLLDDYLKSDQDEEDSLIYVSFFKKLLDSGLIPEDQQQNQVFKLKLISQEQLDAKNLVRNYFEKL